jgi:hypothetical protein
MSEKPLTGDDRNPINFRFPNFFGTPIPGCLRICAIVD